MTPHKASCLAPRPLVPPPTLPPSPLLSEALQVCHPHAAGIDIGGLIEETVPILQMVRAIEPGAAIPALVLRPVIGADWVQTTGMQTHHG